MQQLGGTTVPNVTVLSVQRSNQKASLEVPTGGRTGIHEGAWGAPGTKVCVLCTQHFLCCSNKALLNLWFRWSAAVDNTI